jgi:hypothetical protein
MKVLLIILFYLIAGLTLFSQNELKHTTDNLIINRENDRKHVEQPLPERNSFNLHKVDEKGNFKGESLPVQNNHDIPYKREEEAKPVNNSKANTPK